MQRGPFTSEGFVDASLRGFDVELLVALHNPVCPIKAVNTPFRLECFVKSSKPFSRLHSHLYTFEQRG